MYSHVSHKELNETNKKHVLRDELDSLKMYMYIRYILRMGEVRTDSNNINSVVSPEHIGKLYFTVIYNQYSRDLIRLTSFIMNFCLDLAVPSMEFTF